MFKKLAALCMAVALLVTVLPIQKVFAEDSTETSTTVETLDVSSSTNIREFADKDAKYDDVITMGDVTYAVFNTTKLTEIYFVDITHLDSSNVYSPIRSPRRAPCFPGDPGCPGCYGGISVGGVENRVIIDFDGWINCMFGALVETLKGDITTATLTYLFKRKTFIEALKAATVAAGVDILAAEAVLNGIYCYYKTTRRA